MKARHFAPVAPLHTQPAGPYATPGECEEVLSDALRGVVLGGYDELICSWLVQSLDLSTLRVLVSLMERIRVAGIQVAGIQEDAGNAPAARHAVAQPYGRGAPGNAGPGY
jgi:hypothetical protein